MSSTPTLESAVLTPANLSTPVRETNRSILTGYLWNEVGHRPVASDKEIFWIECVSFAENSGKDFRFWRDQAVSSSDTMHVTLIAPFYYAMPSIVYFGYATPNSCRHCRIVIISAGDDIITLYSWSHHTAISRKKNNHPAKPVYTGLRHPRYGASIYCRKVDTKLWLLFASRCAVVCNTAYLCISRHSSRLAQYHFSTLQVCTYKRLSLVWAAPVTAEKRIAKPLDSGKLA